MSLINNFPYDGIVTVHREMKDGYTTDDLQMRVAEMCENVKTYHSETGFIGSMVVLAVVILMRVVMLVSA